MRIIAVAGLLCLGITLAASRGTAGQAMVPLTPVMSAWSHNLSAINAMLDGRRAYDAAFLRRAVALYIADASHLAAAIPGRSAEAADLRRRFSAFSADSRAALAAVSEPPAFERSLHRMTDDCHSCHNLYN